MMELVEGETLAQLVSKGLLPPAAALDICRQIAEGPETAHGQGIIHRDLKPANVQVTSEGKAKILDFGLARVFLEQVSNAAQAPTITSAMSRPGTVLGTAAYMSPEQAKGMPVDKQTDIWGFGCVLFESLTGKRPFQGATTTEIVASVLKSEPDWQALPADTPAPIRRLLRRWPKAGLWRVSSNGGAAQLIAKPSEGSEGSSLRYNQPEILPNNRGILFTILKEGRTSITIHPSGADRPRILIESGNSPRYFVLVQHELTCAVRCVGGARNTSFFVLNCHRGYNNY